MAGDHGICRIEICLDPGSERAKGVKPFAARPLPILELQVAGRDIIGDRVPEDKILGLLGGYPAAGFSDHNRQLPFMFDLLGLWRQENGAAMGDDRGGGFEEDQRYFRDFCVVFRGMGSIVAAHADDLAWLNRWEQLNFFDGGFCFEAAELFERAAIDLADFPIFRPTEGWRLRRALIANNTHVYLQMLSVF